MSWKVHGTDEVFAALRGLCSNSYRMYDPSEYRSYYDHDCDVYECAVEDAAQEYERLLKHCEKQREELSKFTRYVQGEAPAETIDLLMELLNEYRESGCAIDESRVSWYARRLGGRTMNERMTNDERTSGAGITEELRDWSMDAHAGWIISRVELDALHAIADRIDAEHKKAVEQAHADGLNEQIDYLERFVPSNYVLLPVDADGVPIHVGDVMEWPTTGETFEVVGIGDGTLFYIEDGSECADWTGATTKRHHQPDTWESIIEDALTVGWSGGWQEAVSADVHDKLVERCERLAGGVE